MTADITKDFLKFDDKNKSIEINFHNVDLRDILSVSVYFKDDAVGDEGEPVGFGVDERSDTDEDNSMR